MGLGLGECVKPLGLTRVLALNVPAVLSDSVAHKDLPVPLQARDRTVMTANRFSYAPGTLFNHLCRVSHLILAPIL